jgi:hypothetical protein
LERVRDGLRLDRRGGLISLGFEGTKQRLHEPQSSKLHQHFFPEASLRFLVRTLRTRKATAKCRTSRSMRYN